MLKGYSGLAKPVCFVDINNYFPHLLVKVGGFWVHRLKVGHSGSLSSNFIILFSVGFNVFLFYPGRCRFDSGCTRYRYQSLNVFFM